MRKSIRIIIVDDHPVVRMGLQAMFAGQTDCEIVGEAATGAEAVALAARLMPDLVLMDLRLPDMDGATATLEIKKQNPQILVLVLTTYTGNADILHAIEAGATGYLLKDTPQEQLLVAIQDIVQGKPVLAPQVATRILHHLRTPAQETLSTREIEVLNLVARGASNKEIGQNLYISEATVKSHLIRIFRKLGVADRSAAVTRAIEQGLLRLG